jgi:hypothetical protein
MARGNELAAKLKHWSVPCCNNSVSPALVSSDQFSSNSWDLSRSPLIIHGHFSPWLGEKPFEITRAGVTLNQRVLGSSPSAPTTNFF